VCIISAPHCKPVWCCFAACCLASPREPMARPRCRRRTSCRSFRDSLRSSRGDSSGITGGGIGGAGHAGRPGARPPAHRTSARCRWIVVQQMLGEMGKLPAPERSRRRTGAGDPGSSRPRIGSSSRLDYQLPPRPVHLTYSHCTRRRRGASRPRQRSPDRSAKPRAADRMPREKRRCRPRARWQSVRGRLTGSLECRPTSLQNQLTC